MRNHNTQPIICRPRLSQDAAARPALTLAALVLAALLAVQATGCALIRSASPIVFAGLEGAIRAMIDETPDPGRRAELELVLRLLHALQAAIAAAEAADRRSIEATAMGHDEAVRTEQQVAIAERKRAEFLTIELRGRMQKLGIANKVE